jgi:hypothetical protein
MALVKLPLLLSARLVRLDHGPPGLIRAKAQGCACPAPARPSPRLVAAWAQISPQLRCRSSEQSQLAVRRPHDADVAGAARRTAQAHHMAATNTRPGREPEVLLSSTPVPLRREFTAGIYTVKKATREGPRYSNQERLLIVHFRWLFFRWPCGVY